MKNLTPVDIFSQQDSHRKHFDHYVHVNNKEADTKDMYFELIKMLLEKEMAAKPDSKKRREIKEVRKIQGYQDLTNKLFRRATRQLMNNYSALKERMERFEKIICFFFMGGVKIFFFLLNFRLKNQLISTKNNFKVYINYNNIIGVNYLKCCNSSTN